MPFKFEKLEVWQKALALSGWIHELTKKFPRDELFVLTSQMKRAADSVVLNIAEGSTGQTNAEFRQFLSYALRSAVEVVACLHLALNRNLIDRRQFDLYSAKAETIIKMTQALRKALSRTVDR